MGRKRKVRGYSILYSDSVCGVSEDRVYDPESEPEKSLFDTLECPIADDVLIALRKSFSLTFPKNPFIEGLRESLTDIRRICVEAAKPLTEVWKDLQMQPVPPYMNDPVVRKTYLFKFVFARTADLDITVKIDGKKVSFLKEVGHEDATQLIMALRLIVSNTFEEAHSERQHEAILRRIRARIWQVLPPLNMCLQSIEVEPMPGPEMRTEHTDEEDWDDIYKENEAGEG
jgi:hypothetical protein